MSQMWQVQWQNLPDLIQTNPHQSECPSIFWFIHFDFIYWPFLSVLNRWKISSFYCDFIGWTNMQVIKWTFTPQLLLSPTQFVFVYLSKLGKFLGNAFFTVLTCVCPWNDLKGGSNCPTIFPQCVSPLLVSTNMTHNMPVNSFVKSAPGFVRDALNTVGYSSHTSGCLSHALQVRDTTECCVTLHITSCCSVFNASLFPSCHSTGCSDLNTPAWLAAYVHTRHQKA